MEGLYKIKMVTPMGMEKGTLLVNPPEGEKLTGNLQIMGNNVDWEGKVTGENTFEFPCEVKKSVLKIPFTAYATVDGDKMTAHTKSSYGEFQITGKKQPN